MEEFLTNTPNGKYYIDVDDCYIRNHLIQGHIFEENIINWMIGNLKQLSNVTYIADVGANIGCHTISYGLADKKYKIYSFEPQKGLFDLLAKNVAVNELTDNVELYNFGLAHKDFSLSLKHVDTQRDEKCKGWNKAGLGIGKGGEEITLKTLDSLNLPGLDFMKIDVEGAEGLVLTGAENTIKKYRPIIMFEHNNQRINPEDVGLDYVPTPFEVLTRLGYRNFQYLENENYITLG